jgi:hypothetical protein
MNAYFWRTDDNIVHHMRAESVADVRERIAATHGDAVARRAVITSVETARTGSKPSSNSKSAAA